jgi:hypothetical protein
MPSRSIKAGAQSLDNPEIYVTNASGFRAGWWKAHDSVIVAQSPSHLRRFSTRKINRRG